MYIICVYDVHTVTHAHKKMLGSGTYGSVRVVKKYGFTRAIKESTFGKWPNNSEVVMACLREEQFNLESPFIVKRYWTRFMPNKFQLCMELGTPLSSDMDVSYAQCFHDILQALYWIHENGFIHRDVKPQNIIRVGKTYKLIDFGLTRRGCATSSMTGYTISRYYRPPEMLDTYDATYDGRVDTYSLGITIWELKNGRPPFVGESKDILRQFHKFRPRGIYKYMICPYEDRLNSKQLLHAVGVKPIDGKLTRVPKREGFADLLVRGLDDEAEVMGHEDIYDEL